MPEVKRYIDEKYRYPWIVRQVGRLMFGLACVALVVAANGVLAGIWWVALGFGAAGIALIISGWRLKGGARLAQQPEGGGNYRIVDRHGVSRWAKWYQ